MVFDKNDNQGTRRKERLQSVNPNLRKRTAGYKMDFSMIPGHRWSSRPWSELLKIPR